MFDILPIFKLIAFRIFHSSMYKFEQFLNNHYFHSGPGATFTEVSPGTSGSSEVIGQAYTRPSPVGPPILEVTTPEGTPGYVKSREESLQKFRTEGAGVDYVPGQTPKRVSI